MIGCEQVGESHVNYNHTRAGEGCWTGKKGEVLLELLFSQGGDMHQGGVRTGRSAPELEGSSLSVLTFTVSARELGAMLPE